MATVSTRACWPTRTVGWRCRGSRRRGSRRRARAPPAAARAAGRPRRPRPGRGSRPPARGQIAVISDVAAAVSGVLVVVETVNSGTAPASASSPPMMRPGPSEPRLDRGVGESERRRHPRGAPSGGQDREQRRRDCASRSTAAAGIQSAWTAKLGGAMPWRTSACPSARPSTIPGQIPAAEPIRATIAASQAIMRRIWPGVAATARSSAISRSRCWIERPSVLATTNIAMNSASPPNAAVTGINVVRVC